MSDLEGNHGIKGAVKSDDESHPKICCMGVFAHGGPTLCENGQYEHEVKVIHGDRESMVTEGNRRVPPSGDRLGCTEQPRRVTSLKGEIGLSGEERQNTE